MAQRLARLHPNPKFARSIPRRPFKLPFNVSRLLLSLLKYVEANLMNLLLEVSASLYDVPEAWSTLLTFLHHGDV